MRYDSLYEARRNPQKNLRDNVISIIRDYHSKRDLYYMSYTNLDKLGINPNSKYATPIGIYSYPLVDDIVDPIFKTGKTSEVPFMKFAPYIWIFHPKNTGRGLYLSDYDSNDYARDILLLRKFAGERNTEITVDVFDSIIEVAEAEALVKTHSGKLWNLTRILSKILVGEDSISFYKDGIIGVGSKAKIIKTGEIVKVVYVYPDYNEYQIEYSDGEREYVKYDEVKKYVENLATENSEEFKKLKFNIGESVMVSEAIAARSVVMWTNILYRVLDYEFVDDSGGLSIIHANEPFQAVFFNRSFIEVDTRFLNPNREVKSAESIFYDISVDDLKKIDQSTIANYFNALLKRGVTDISAVVPHKFRGFVRVNSSKLQAKLILADLNMVEVFSSVNRDTVRILDEIMISRINKLDNTNVEDTTPIWNYFGRFHNDVWPEGERAVLTVALRDNNPDLINDYILSVRKYPNKEFPQAERLILSKPKLIPNYARMIGRRWSAGERVLARGIESGTIDDWIVKSYANLFNISVSDIGKI